MLNPIRVDDEVYWTDPSGDCSGSYVVIKSPDGEEPNPDATKMDVFLLDTEEGIALEVFRYELS